jgi:hypothetical protein
MKKLIFLMFLPGITSAVRSQVDFGPKAGLNYHFQSVALGDGAPDGAEVPEGTNGLGFHVGGFITIGLTKTLYLRPEVLYSNRYSDRQESSDVMILGVWTTLEREDERTMSYFEVPVLVAYKLSKTFSIHAGPALGFLVSNKVQTTGKRTVTSNGQTVTYSLDDTTDSTDGLRTVEYAGVIGLGYQARNGLDVGVRYWRGLNTLNEDTDLLRINQNLVQFSLGFALFKNK